MSSNPDTGTMGTKTTADDGPETQRKQHDKQQAEDRQEEAKTEQNEGSENKTKESATSADNTEGKNDKEEWEVQRDHHKQKADTAFRCQGYKTAIEEYSKAISLDPEMIVLYSNRSAAYLKNSEKSRALKDAEKVVQLDPKYVKGHSRLAAALHSLRRYEKAMDSYGQVLKLDPNNAAAKKGMQECKNELDRIQKQHEEEQKLHQQEDMKEKEEEEKQKKADDEGEEEDDLLNDFFADVEEVTSKSKDGPNQQEQPKATHAIKHDKVHLGTSETQMERLLKANFEWRNLNPFYVLQLPHTATEEDISRRYKALSLMLHPDKNNSSERAQRAFDEVKKAKTVLSDLDRAKHIRQLVEEGMKIGEQHWNQSNKKKSSSSSASSSPSSLEESQEREIMRIFAQVEQKRREVEQRERKFEQRERQQEDEVLEKERQARQFDKKWRTEERVGKRVGNWRNFANKKKKK